MIGLARVDRHILREWVPPFVAGTLGLIGIVLANTIVKSTETIFQVNAPWSVVSRWLLLRVPVIITFALPVGSMLGVALVVLRLGRDNEIVALRMGGVSVRRLFVPFVLAGLAVSVAAVLNNELAAPHFAARSNEVLLRSILMQPGQVIKNNATFRTGGDSFCHVSRVDLQRQVMEFVLIYRLERGRPREAIIAARAERRAGRWLLLNGHRTWFDQAGRLQRVEPFAEHPVEFAPNLTEMWDETTDPEQLTARELLRRIRLLRLAGDRLNETRYRYALHARFSVPLTCLIFTLLAAPLSYRVSGPKSHPFAGVLLTIVVVFFANGTINWAKTIALSGQGAWIPPALAAWLHVLVFGGLSLALIARAER